RLRWLAKYVDEAVFREADVTARANLFDASAAALVSWRRRSADILRRTKNTAHVLAAVGRHCTLPGFIRTTEVGAHRRLPGEIGAMPVLLRTKIAHNFAVVLVPAAAFFHFEPRQSF